ncbi:MAG: vWA domain-containing protein [Pseudomonadota bacterium]
MLNKVIPAIVILAAIGFFIWDEQSTPPPVATSVDNIDPSRLNPNWGAIGSWPPNVEDGASAQSNPDPWQVTTLIILDDSGSMADQMDAAKQAVVEAVGQFAPDSRVGVLALNGGMILPVTTAQEAAGMLAAELDPIQAEGRTPLGARLSQAAQLLTSEAQLRRGFGTFRILVTTDGAATDGGIMNDAVANILTTTPIELATIGLGIGEGHALNVPGYTDYVSVGSVSELSNALQAAAAEQTVFQPVTKFEE